MHVCENIFITCYSLPTCFDRCHGHHQGNIKINMFQKLLQCIGEPRSFKTVCQTSYIVIECPVINCLDLIKLNLLKYVGNVMNTIHIRAVG